MFHVRQALKFEVITTLTAIVTLVFIWTIVIPVITGIFLVVLFVCRIIAFFSICGGKAKEPYIIRSFRIPEIMRDSGKKTVDIRKRSTQRSDCSVSRDTPAEES